MESSPAESSSSPSSGQWASGRKLTKSQRERKRAVDRNRISKRREQTAERIAVLEAKLAEVTAELEALKRTKILSSEPFNDATITTTTTTATTSSSESNSQETPQSDTPEMLNNDDELWADTVLGIPPPVTSPPLCSLDTTTPFQACADVDMDILSASVPHTILPNHPSVSNLTNEDLSLNPYLIGPTPATSTVLLNSSDRSQKSDCQRIFGRSVRKARTLTASDVCTNPALNDDALIRGVIHSWAEVEARSEFFCPLWEVLEYLDKRIFMYAGAMTRLPCLRMIHELLLCLVKASSVRDLPSWYRPRQAQYQFPHPLAADLLPWPGLRERAVLSHTLTQTNKFWTELVYSFRFGFPPSSTIYEVATLNKDTDRWSFTGRFLNHVHDIRVWHMDPEFFVNWPETYYDIVPTPDIGRSLTLSLTTTEGIPAEQQQRGEFLWRAGERLGDGDGDEARRFHRRHLHLLPLPPDQGEDRAANSTDDDEDWDVLSWRQDMVLTSAPRSRFMPAVFHQ